MLIAIRYESTVKDVENSYTFFLISAWAFPAISPRIMQLDTLYAKETNKGSRKNRNENDDRIAKSKLDDRWRERRRNEVSNYTRLLT